MSESLIERPQEQRDHEKCMEMATPGVAYRHYRGGRYSVILVAHHHEHRPNEFDVVYVSLTFGRANTRPLFKDSRGEDSWVDMITWPDGSKRGRFTPEWAISADEMKVLEALWTRQEK